MEQPLDFDKDNAERDPQDPEVLRLLLQSHARFLEFVERRVGSRELAEDILQDAFVRSLDHSASLRNADSAIAWFYRVLRNAIIDHIAGRPPSSERSAGSPWNPVNRWSRTRSWRRWYARA